MVPENQISLHPLSLPQPSGDQHCHCHLPLQPIPQRFQGQPLTVWLVRVEEELDPAKDTAKRNILIDNAI